MAHPLDPTLTREFNVAVLEIGEPSATQSESVLERTSQPTAWLTNWLEGQFIHGWHSAHVYSEPHALLYFGTINFCCSVKNKELLTM